MDIETAVERMRADRAALEGLLNMTGDDDTAAKLAELDGEIADIEAQLPWGD